MSNPVIHFPSLSLIFVYYLPQYWLWTIVRSFSSSGKDCAISVFKIGRKGKYNFVFWTKFSIVTFKDACLLSNVLQCKSELLLLCNQQFLQNIYSLHTHCNLGANGFAPYKRSIILTDTMRSNINQWEMIIWMNASMPFGSPFCCWSHCALANLVNTLRPRQDSRHFADDIFKCIFLNENVWIPIKISLKFVP